MLERIGYAQEVRDTVDDLRATMQRSTKEPAGSAGLGQFEQLLAAEGMPLLRQLREAKLASSAQPEQEELKS